MTLSATARSIIALIKSVGLPAPHMSQTSDVAFEKVEYALEKLIAVAKAAERHPIVCNLLPIDDERFDDYQERDQELIDALSMLDIEHDEEDDDLEEAQ